MMWLLVGLGNPGARYQDHRHNVGFMLLDRIQQQPPFSSWRSKFDGLISEGRIGDHRICLIKPMTFMNESGRTVGQAMRFFKPSMRNIVVFHDELDLAPFKVRTKIGGGVAGHNGLKSIAAHLGSPAFKRVRIGIGHPGDKNRVHNHVLGDFSKAEQNPLDLMLDTLSTHVNLLINGDDSQYMNKLAVAMQPPKPKSADKDPAKPSADPNKSG